MVATLVHVPGVATVIAQKSKPASKSGTKSPGVVGGAAVEIGRGTENLPAPVLEMREAILAAVKSGRIEEIRVPIEMNEIKPSFGDGPMPDPVTFLKAQSADSEGREVLVALETLLEAPYAILPLGRDFENNRIYVWPSFAETGVSDLMPEQQGELRRLAPEAVANEMLAKGGRYTWWRVGIAADGTWHIFSK